MKYRAITISLLSVMIFFLAISSYLLVSATNIAPTVIYLPASTEQSPHLEDSANQGTSTMSWEGEWSRNSQSSPGTLTITDETATGFSFSLMSLSGVNVGELEGTATIYGERATGKPSEDFETEKKNVPFGLQTSKMRLKLKR